jgi:hypothetical protein
MDNEMTWEEEHGYLIGFGGMEIGCEYNIEETNN